MPKHVNRNAATGEVEEIDDRGDGTGTRTVKDKDGKVLSTEEVTGLPIEEPVPPAPVVPATLTGNATQRTDALLALVDQLAARVAWLEGRG